MVITVERTEYLTCNITCYMGINRISIKKILISAHGLHNCNMLVHFY